MTKKVKLLMAAILFAMLTGIPLAIGDLIGAFTGVVIVAVLSFWSWDTRN